MYNIERRVRTLQLLVAAGRWLVAKARQRASQDPERGVYQAAVNLRKQGVPLALAVAILARRDAC